MEDSVKFYNRPCAAPGLISYRYPSAHYKGSFIMIGAHGHKDALKEAARSVVGVDPARLEIWDKQSGRYVPVDYGE